MDKNLYRHFLWHLRYIESLLDANLDGNISEENAKALALGIEQNEVILTSILKTGAAPACNCPVCGAKVHFYLPFGETPRKNAQCPNCQSVERHRALWIILNSLRVERRGMKILHFAPEPIFHKRFSSIPDVDYYPVDLNPKAFGIRQVVDITDIPFDDDIFDLIMATHVLEHIPDDRKAMSELYRVLKPNKGIALLTVPIFNTPNTFENPEYNTPELRLKYYGQADHVRKYGLDYPDRLRTVKFSVEEITLGKFLSDNDLKKFGVSKNEKFHICRKLIE